MSTETPPRGVPVSRGLPPRPFHAPALGAAASDWRHRAECVTYDDPELWFGEDNYARASAARICDDCPVIAECLAWATGTRPPIASGIWGGMLLDGGAPQRINRHPRTLHKPRPRQDDR